MRTFIIPNDRFKGQNVDVTYQGRKVGVAQINQYDIKITVDNDELKQLILGNPGTMSMSFSIRGEDDEEIQGSGRSEGGNQGNQAAPRGYRGGRW